ncbi:MAG: TIM44-like domain-containing protein [Aureispira sp.]|nr:TIM44-like domain-containing protein [Aureispira sp.]
MKKILNSKYFKIAAVFLGLIVVCLWLLPEALNARPGGGHSFSGGGGGGGGGGGSYGGSGGSGDGEGIAILIEILFRIFLMLPFEAQITIIILIIIGTIIYQLKKQGGLTKTSTYTRSSGTSSTVGATYHGKSMKIEALYAEDEQFSSVLFLDFAHSMFNKYYTYQGQAAKMKTLSPFLTDNIKSKAKSSAAYTQRREEVVIGNLYIQDIKTTDKYTKLIVDFHANYTTESNARLHRHIVVERWVFARKKGLETPFSDKMISLACPNCGAANDFNDAGVCGHCNTLVEAGEMNWMVENIRVQNHHHVPISSLGSYAPEVGTNNATIVDSKLYTYEQEFVHRHKLPNFDDYWISFQKNIVKPTFLAMYQAWSTRCDWHKVRHVLTDRLYESNDFWIKMYKDANLFNRLEKIDIQDVVLSKITLDKHYEAFTIRVFASCIDYTEKEGGKLIGGSKTRPRRFSEYWTFVRRTGVEAPETEFDVAKCASCGAPADKMSDTAVCGYCGTKTNLGEHSWVLSNIAQDEVYKG